MPQMKIVVQFLPSVAQFATRRVEPGEKPPKTFFILWACPTCRKTFLYDGKQRMDCADCKKREEDLAEISGIGAPLARKERL